MAALFGMFLPCCPRDNHVQDPATSHPTHADTGQSSPRPDGGVGPQADAGTGHVNPDEPPPEVLRDPPNLASDQPCEEPEEVAIFVTPSRPMHNRPMRFMVVSDRDIPTATIWARSPDGETSALRVRRFHGPPHAWSAVIPNPGRGVWRIALASGEQVHACEDMNMRVERAGRSTRDQIWYARDRWNRAFENLYSAWIMQLFYAPPDERPSWLPLHEVLRDPERNFLYNRLGMGEDGPNRDRAVSATPDCADMPYYLRAYFAWKMRLPFAYSSCNRGRDGQAPTCNRVFSNLDPPIEALEQAGMLPDGGLPDGGFGDAGFPSISERLAFDAFMNRRVVQVVQSGAGRTLPENNRSDFYSVELSRESIRPGTVFVDPYGHLLVVSQWVDQTDGAAGMLFAVDGHPDLSIGRKRFWQGAFLFVDDLSWGAGGFKAFRPISVRRRRDGELYIRQARNEEIEADPVYGNYSDEQYHLGTQGFYDRMDRVLNPNPLDPVAAQAATLHAFFELVQERVDSVVAGEQFMARRSHNAITMPEGPAIFETSGAWEDYSTPARDMRLLIAMDLVTRFPHRIGENPGAFSIPAGQSPAQVAESLRRAQQAYLSSHHITYSRSNGSEQRLSLADVLARATALEMAYNPNDCIEIRWGAAVGSAEMSSCQRRAPEDQQALMASYRPWFHNRRRPPRE